ncbi:MAG: tetratricopeptide repeat protein [Planctomycetia bacterium]|nr:tetratricopeptide repeat protein [Planctomycetia bacterium]
MNRSLVLGFALAAAVGANVAFAADPTPVDVAVEHFKAGRFDEALEATERVARDDALRARAAYLAGEVSLARGDALGAQGYFQEAAELKPVAPVLASLGRAYQLQGKGAEAVEALTKAVALDAKTARYRAWLGLAQLAAGHADLAKKEVAAAVKAAPGDPDVAKAAVEERLAAQDADGAAKAAAAFAKAAKDHPLGPFLEAVVLDRAGKTDDAIAAYERALKLDDAFLDAHKNLAILCVTQNPLYSIPKRTALAMKHFEAYASRGGKDADVLQVYATLKSFLVSQGGGGK